MKGVPLRLLPAQWPTGTLVSYRAAPKVYLPAIVIADAGEPATHLTVHVLSQGEVHAARTDITPRTAPIHTPLQPGDQVQGLLNDPNGLHQIVGPWTVTRAGLSVTLTHPGVTGERVADPARLTLRRRADLALALAELHLVAGPAHHTPTRPLIPPVADLGPLFGGAL